MENVAKTSKFNQSRADGSESSHEPKKKKLRQNNGNGDAVNTTAYVQVNLWGSSDLKLLMEAMKSFIPHAAIVHTKLIFDDHHFLVDNKAVKISAILLRPHLLEGSHVKPCEISVIYVCELHEIRGKFNKEKADALGLTVKEKYRILQRGDSVKSDLLDIMVHPSDVFGPSIPGPIVFIVDCPTESLARVLLSSESLNGYYSNLSGNPPLSTKGPVSKLCQSIFAEHLLKFNLSPHAHLGLDKSNVPSLIAHSDVINELLIDIPEIVDAAQHVNKYGKEGADNAVRNLTCVWISRPMQLKRFLDEYQSLEDLNMQFLDCRDTMVWNSFEGLLKKIETERACWQCCGLFFTEELEESSRERNNSAEKVIPGWKLVDSGDTRPCLELIEAATFEDGMLREAVARNESTTKEAIGAGDSADAYRLILTHFSLRYPKIPSLDEISIQ
ncbi:hypothetical protein POTOM_037084 [Populus tomentosa]|uniref:Uncharacterized protein n=1 Tax=Populus tomentosa TaxID=118781 RepID=A0A8X7Z1E1_POPTO|nr:hypothetical protein POTOM_037084 [Populus tomentosa]